MRQKPDASPAATSLAMTTKPHRRSAIPVLFAAALVLLLVLTSFASADSLGKVTLYKSGLQEAPFIKGLTPGPDGNVWYIDNKFASGVPAIGKITPAGTITEYLATEVSPTLTGLNEGSDPVALVAGPGGSKYLWFTDRGITPAIGVVDSASPEAAKEFSIQALGGNEGSIPQGIAVGSDGNLWFADASESKPSIGKIELGAPNEAVKITECSAGLNPGSVPRGIAPGPDGNLWFTDTGSTRAIGKVKPSTCEITEFATGENGEPGGSGANPFGPWGIAAGPDGNVWFTEAGTNEANGKAICRMLTSGEVGKFNCFKEGLTASSVPAGLTAAPDGKLWFTNADGTNEKQTVKFEGTWATGNEFELCGKKPGGEVKCVKKLYSTTVSALRKNVKEGLESIFGAGTIPVNPACSGTPFTCTFIFQGGELVGTNIDQASCKALTGIGSCSTSTNTQGVPYSVGSITTSGAITLYPIDGLATVSGITAGSDGNVWFSAGFASFQKLGKIGIGEKYALKVTKTGTGSGTVTSSPSGINCGGDCEESYYEYQEVTLEAEAKAGSEFTGWSGSGCSGTGTCKVTM